MKKQGSYWILLTLCLALLVAFWVVTPDKTAFKQVARWQSLASPGELSAAHAALEKDCSACHAVFGGIREADCIGCHALAARLLNWPENIFHADLGNCVGCHPEHLGRNLPPTRMDHVRLARYSLAQLQSSESADGESGGLGGQLRMWLRHQNASGAPPPDSPWARSEEVLLNCFACHAGSDIHAELFGRDCLACHTTEAWTIPAYRHPLGRSSDCFECHKAPKSHFKGHFNKMRGRVGDCYMCHSTPDWLDIGHPDWYKQWLQQLGSEEVESLFDEAPMSDLPLKE